MKVCKQILVIFLFTLTHFFTANAITPAEITRQIDDANALRLKDSKGSIQPLYDGFIAANENGLDDESARALAYLGWALYNNSYPELSMQTFSYAQKYCSKQNTKLRDLISLGMGACYASTTDFARGEKQLLKGLRQSHADGNKREEMMLYTYLGNLYSEQAKEAKSKECFEKGRDITHVIKDTIFESALYCNIGTLEPNIDKAEENLFKSIDLCQQSGNKTTECYAYVNLSELYFNNKDYGKALRITEQINRLMPYVKKNDKIIAYSHSLLSQIYAAQNDYATAYNQMSLALKQQQIDDAQIEQERVTYSLIVSEIVKQCEKHSLQQQKKESTNTLLIMLVVSIAILLVAILMFILYRKSKQQQRLLLAKNNEISQLQATTTEHKTVIDDTRRTMNYFYGFYRGRYSMLEKLSQMVKESYKMSNAQLISHLRILNNTITHCLAKDKEPDFVTKLETENDEFVKRLLERYPDLSKTDILLATYYRLGMSTREISRLSGKLPTTVTTARYRLRTSLNIPEDTDLTEFFNSI
jgi:tetratricopeptide (TPR) repeat protein